MNNALIYIQSIDEFQQFKSGVEGCSLVGIDTEFERTRTYWPNLCLFQIATSEAVFVIEPNAFDMPWLSNFMADTRVTKIFHSCRQDLEAFYALSGVVPQNTFDTQVAATLVGRGDQISYADLCQGLLSVRLSKEFQFSNWATRPLLPQQIYYAANDARYLISLYQDLMHQLQQADRQELMRNIMCVYEDTTTYQKTARHYFMNKLHLPSQSLEHAYALYQLAEWREQYCQKHNVIRRLVFEDEDLKNIAPELLFVDFLPEHPMRETLYQVIQSTGEGQQIPDFLKAKHIGHPLKAIHTKIRSALTQLNIPMHYVITQNMMVDFLIEPSHDANPLFNSWRYSLLEPCIEKLLMIKSKFQAQQNQGKAGDKNVG